MSDLSLELMKSSESVNLSKAPTLRNKTLQELDGRYAIAETQGGYYAGRMIFLYDSLVKLMDPDTGTSFVLQSSLLRGVFVLPARRL